MVPSDCSIGNSFPAAAAGAAATLCLVLFLTAPSLFHFQFLKGAASQVAIQINIKDCLASDTGNGQLVIWTGRPLIIFICALAKRSRAGRRIRSKAVKRGKYTLNWLHRLQGVSPCGAIKCKLNEREQAAGVGQKGKKRQKKRRQKKQAHLFT